MTRRYTSWIVVLLPAVIGFLLAAIVPEGDKKVVTFEISL